ncbi:MAG: hypothetical protein WC291_04590 [Thermodesulfovibrionales bacterium]|jgi:uncharacterized protein YozE (UPF0346 family)
MMNRKLRTEPSKSGNLTDYYVFVFYFAELKFNHLRQYFEEVSRYLESEAVKLDEELKAEVKSLGYLEEEADFYYDSHYSDEIEIWDRTFPHIILSSVLMAACSLLESALTNACHYLERDGEEIIRCKWADIPPNDTGIKRANLFLQKNVCIHLEDHPNWQNILAYYHVRDTIVHAGGDLSHLNQRKRHGVEDALRKFKKSGISADYGNKIQLQASFLDKVLNEMTTFWKDLGTAFKENDKLGPRYWP